MHRWSFALILAFAPLFFGCGGGSKGPAMADVKGKVTLDGSPLASGKIIFDEGPGIPATELDIKDGNYQGQTTVGSKTVRISAFKAVASKGLMKGGPGYETTQENYLPAKFNTASKDVREVKAGVVNEFDFAVTSK